MLSAASELVGEVGTVAAPCCVDWTDATHFALTTLSLMIQLRVA